MAVRWECPNGHAAVLGPKRPRRDSIVRFCLPCSEEAGRLVERTAPVVERRSKALAEKREAKEAAKREAARVQRQREKESERQRKEREAQERLAYLTVRTQDAVGRMIDVNVEDELRVMARKVLGRKSSLARGHFTVKVRRSDVGTWHGHAKPWRNEIVLTLPKGINRWEDLQVLLLHELVHVYSRAVKAHDRIYRQDFARACGKVWPGLGRIPWKPAASKQYSITKCRLYERTRREVESR